MIDIEKYKVILDEGLLLDHYLLLTNIRDGKELLKSRRVDGFINLMCKKGYIENGTLTDKALVVLEGSLGTPKPIVFKSDIVVESIPEEKTDEKFYAKWVLALHRKCEQKIQAATGKRQVRDKIDGKAYSFLPNPTDLGKVILRVIHTYKFKVKDLPNIESAILKYIDRCIKANKWFPILGYYIMKNGMSPMVTDMDSDEDEPTENPGVHIV